MDQEQASDVVNNQWLTRHGIRIPRASGVFQSKSAWVKTNTTGDIVAAGEKDQTVLAWLVEKQILNSGDVDYGIAYVTCRSAERAYRKERGYKSSLDLPFLSGGTGLSCEQAAQVFCLMRRYIGQRNCSIIEYCCDHIRTSDDVKNQPYRKAFTALAKAFDTAIKEVREGRVPDDPTAGLKKTLARSPES
jgi:hypothetical protein